MLAQIGEMGWLEPYLVRLGDSGPAGLVGVVVAVLAAFAVGVAHGLAPGHGKVFAIALMAGGRARSVDALLLGAAVAVTHAASVLLLGALLYATRRGAGDFGVLAPALTAMSGAVVAAVGAALLWRHSRVREHAHVHAGAGAVAARSSGLRSRAAVLGVGASGGLLPSPSAFLVLATSVFAGYAWFGVLLVMSFSIGLAATVSAVGIAALHGRLRADRLAERRPWAGRAAALLPLASAWLLLLGGLAVLAAALLSID